MKRSLMLISSIVMAVFVVSLGTSTAYGSESVLLNLNPAVVVQRELRSGCEGNDVWWLQYTLSDLGYKLGPHGCDGLYGRDTKQAVAHFQKDNGIKLSGTADKATIAVLEKLSSIETIDKPTVSRGKTTCREFELMCMVVWKEARGEPFEGQVAVAEVILTRVKSPHFPNTISGVVLQPAAFTGFTGNHHFTDESVSAVELAFTGTSYSDGADHFCDLNECSPSWAKDQYLVAHIESHWFYNLHREEE